MNKTYKMMFLMALVSSTIISISASSWLTMWIGLEINLLSIIPLMHSSKNIYSSEASVKYFTVQAIASTIILMSVIMTMLWSVIPSSMEKTTTLAMTLNSALMTKMGMAPYHFWFPEVMEGLNWMNCLLILTWQKLAPMVLLMYNLKSLIFMTLVITSAMIISGVMGMNQLSIRKIMAFSSINHMGWMISSMMVMESIWLMYFIVYSILSVNIVLIFSKLKIFFLSQLYQTLNNMPMQKILFSMNFLSLSGIPPFLGFLPKWLTIQALVNEGMMFLPLIMIVMTIIMIYVYIRITLSTLLMNSEELLQPSKMENFNYFSMAMFNFVSLASLMLVTLWMNMT